MPIQVGSSAMCVARRFTVMLFSWGCQLNLSLGTADNILRVVMASCSSSWVSASSCVMIFLFLMMTQSKGGLVTALCQHVFVGVKKVDFFKDLFQKKLISTSLFSLSANEVLKFLFVGLEIRLLNVRGSL